MAEARIDRHSAVIEQDLPAIYSFIAERDPAAAERVLDAMERILPVSDFRNYLVFYRVETASIRILYVTHGARHLLRLFRREPRE